MIKEKEILEINNKEYVVVSVYNDYSYLINTDNFNDVLFVKLYDCEVEVINNKNQLNKLIKMFNEIINKKKLSEN